jgi:glycosyltransferase
LKISIITAALNCARTIGEALDSVRMQQGVDIEHIVIDGGSVDDTMKVVARAQKRLACVVSEPDRGIYDAINKGLARSTGDIVGILHADDRLADSSVLADVAKLFEDPAVDVVYGDLQYVSAIDGSKVVRHWCAGEFCPRRLARGWMIPHPTLYVRRRVLERIGTYDLRYKIASDYDYILRVLSDADFGVAYLPRVMVRMRAGGISNRTWRNILRKSHEDLRILSERRVAGWWSLAPLFWKNVGKLSQFAPLVASRLGRPVRAVNRPSVTLLRRSPSSDTGWDDGRAAVSVLKTEELS